MRPAAKHPVIAYQRTFLALRGRYPTELEVLRYFGIGPKADLPLVRRLCANPTETMDEARRLVPERRIVA